MEASLRRILDVLRDACGCDGWLAFDTLMSAVRDGDIRPEVDRLALAFLTGYPGRLGAIRHSFQVVRALRGAGLEAQACGDTFATVAIDVDGSRRHVGVYACWKAGDTLVMSPGLRVEAGAAALQPLSAVVLGGTTLPVPADPHTILAATYGKDWQHQQRPFHVRRPPVATTTPGFGRHRRRWERFYRGFYGLTAPREPSRFSRWVADDLSAQENQTPAVLVDVGCGNGRDLLAFADQGYELLGVDYASDGLEVARDLVAGRQGRVACRTMDLYDLRSVLLLGAELAGGERRPVLYARFVAHALEDDGRDNLWRLGATALRRGGRMYLEFRTHRDESCAHVFEDQHFRRYLDPEEVAAELERHGGAVVHREQGHGLAPYLCEDPHICRMVVQWAK
ncbi:MAG TPA: class I SAM-dependent methyltransferase [Nocardioidaceae bacterium]|nr:class I SAM-dependent methyltransferase [Nocardioidaceae bacterium]